MMNQGGHAEHIQTVLATAWRAIGGRLGARIGQYHAGVPKPGARLGDDAFHQSFAETIIRHKPTLKPVAGRVIHVSSTLGSGGTERQLVNTVNEMVRRGMDCRYLGLFLSAAPGNDFLLDDLVANNVAWTELGKSPAVAQKGLMLVHPDFADYVAAFADYKVDIILNLVEEFTRQRPEIVHAWLDETNICVGIAAAIAGVPKIVMSLRSVNPCNFPFVQSYMRPAYRALARLPNTVFLSNSDAGGRSYANWLDIPRDAISTVRNGLDTSRMKLAARAKSREFRERFHIPADVRLMGSVYRLGEEKQPFLWIDVAWFVSKVFPHCHFVIAGGGPLKDQMAAYANSLGLGARLHLCGVVRDVDALLGSLDVFLLTSRAEGLPNVVVEAQAMGVPAVAPDVGGVSEAILDRRTGRVAALYTAESLAKYVIEVLSDETAQERARIEGPRFVSQRFGLKRSVDEVIAHYQGKPVAPISPAP